MIRRRRASRPQVQSSVICQTEPRSRVIIANRKRKPGQVHQTPGANPAKFTRRRAGAPCLRRACRVRRRRAHTATHVRVPRPRSPLTHRHTRHIGNATNGVGRAH
eukprot:537317-Prymnesium_polylepis.1